MKTLLAALALCLALSAPSKATGISHFSIGASTGTNLVLLSATPQTYWGVQVTSAAANDLFKCWDSAALGTLTISSAATLGGQMYQTAATEAGPNNTAVSAAAGVVCGKSSTSSEFVIYTSAQ